MLLHISPPPAGGRLILMTARAVSTFFSICRRDVDFGEIFGPEIRAKHPVTTYNLLANIVHDGQPGKGTYRVHVLHKATGKWFEMQDLHVTEILPQMLTLTEAYIQVKSWLSMCVSVS